MSSVATGESEATAPKQEQSLSEEILSLMRGEEPVAPAQTQEEEVPETAVEEIPQQSAEEIPEEEPEEAPTQVAAETRQWPQSASKRVAEETEKRRRQQSRADKAEDERDRWMERAAQLETQLQEAKLPRPNARDPLADVFDLAGLQKAKGHYEQIKSVSSRALDENPTLDEIEIVVGKDKQGEPVTETFTRRKLIDMREDAERARSKFVPERQNVLVARQQADALALKVYPQFAENEGDNQWTGFVQDTLARIPDLAKVPDIAIWLGHALTGRQVTLERLQKQIGKNGELGETPPGTAKEILSAASRKFKAAPPVSTGRVPSQSTPRRGADVEAARKTMRARPGDDDAMEAFIDAKLFRSPSRGYTKVS